LDCFAQRQILHAHPHLPDVYAYPVFGLGSAIKKNYTHVKIVLDDALTKYVHQGGSFKSKRPTKHGMYTFLHTTSFPCIKQPEGSHKDAYYALYHMLALVWDQKNLTLPESLQPWAQKLAMIDDDNLRG
jgi:hypothetical protein